MLSGKYTQFDQSAEKSAFYQYAVEAIELINKRFPQGAINQVETVKKHQISQANIVKQLRIFVMLAEEMDKKFKDLKLVSALAKYLEPLQGANCGVLTNYAAGYLMTRHPKLAIECVFLGNDHNLLAIGRPAKSDPNNIKTWKNTLLCDVWAQQIYLAQNFDKVRNSSPDIKFYGLDKWNNRNSVIVQNDWTGKHYLSGEPDIITGPLSKAYDKAWVRLVELDQVTFMKKKIEQEEKPYVMQSKVAVSFNDAPASIYMGLRTLFGKPEEAVRIFDVENGVRFQP